MGAGNPAWLAEAPVEPEHAWAVGALLDAGAAVRGIARTDEFAYSLAGTNAHSGTPPNARAPHRISGGSTSGSASAVALGHATIGLGTDTGGSIRVPASYQGLFGIRTTHDAVPRDGLLALSPSFDAVGWVTRDAARLAAVGDVLLPRTTPTGLRELVTVADLTRIAEPEVGDVVDEFAADAGARGEDWDLSALPDWLTGFQTLQAWEAWRERGPWLSTRLDTLGADVRGRFEAAALIDDARAEAARRQVAAARDQVRDLVGDRVLVLPSASSVAPLIGQGLDVGPHHDHVPDLPGRSGRTARGQHPALYGIGAAGRGVPGRRSGSRPRPSGARRRSRVKRYVAETVVSVSRHIGYLASPIESRLGPVIRGWGTNPPRG